MSEEPPGSQLPSSYVSPWWLLGQDLQAVGASLVLRLRELWRRNGSGDLPRPEFWPRRWGALFWPLVVMGALLLLLALGRWAGLGISKPTLPSPLPDPSVATTASALAPALAPALPSPEVEATPAPEDEGEAREGDAPPELPPTPELALDPLLELITGGEKEPLIRAVRPQPEQGRLALELDGEGFLALPPAQRQRLADRWQQRVADLGYGALDLVEGGDGGRPGRLLGRQARVGTGMILLAFG